MATRFLTRALISTAKSLISIPSHSYSTPLLRPLAAASASYLRRLAPATSTRWFAASSNRPPHDITSVPGCDFEHWLVVMEPAEDDLSRDQLIDLYIKTLAMVIGSEEEAKMQIYSVTTRYYYAFGALVPQELCHRIQELPHVRYVLPDSYLDVKNKKYSGEPFINGQAVPIDPKSYDEWVIKCARENEGDSLNDTTQNSVTKAQEDEKDEGS